MRFALVTPSLAFRIDGVADYAATLGRHLVERGHEVLLLGVNDWQPGGADAEADQDRIRIRNLRADEPWEKRRLVIAEEFRRFRPDLTEVQYYWRGYWAGGRYFRLAHALRRGAGRGARCLVFHETWGGVGTIVRRPAWLGTAFLAATLVAFARIVQPTAATTSTPLFQNRLRRLGLATQLVPIPSNIPVVPRSDQDRVADRGRLGADDDTLLAVLFGRIPPEWPAGEALSALEALRRSLGRTRGLLLSIGRQGYDGAGWIQLVRASAGAGWKADAWGLRDPPEISAALQAADLGIATTPWIDLGKSGVAATLREHGLPIFVVEPADLTDGMHVRPGPQLIESFHRARGRARPPSAWPRLAQRLETLAARERHTTVS